MFVSALLPGRTVEEQLFELTRLVVRLPEVDSLLQRAGLQPTVTRLEPTSVLEMFVKVTHAHWCQAHCGLLMVSATVNPVSVKCLIYNISEIKFLPVRPTVFSLF